MPLKEDYIRESITYLDRALSLNSSNVLEFRGCIGLSIDFLRDFENEYRNPMYERWPLDQPFKGVDEAVDVLEEVRNFSHLRQVRIARGMLYEALEELPSVNDPNQLQINF